MVDEGPKVTFYNAHKKTQLIRLGFFAAAEG